MNTILDDLSKMPWKDQNTKTILTGDLNATSDEPAIQSANRFLKDAFHSLHPQELGYTWSNLNPLARFENLPDRRIDYILCSKEIFIKRCEVILNYSYSSSYASDHFGVFAELDL